MTRTVTDAVIEAIPGWFLDYDIAMFRLLLQATLERGHGDLAELGAYKGKSAVLIGSSVQDDEVFTVVDLWGSPPTAEDNKAENREFYEGLERIDFERNYKAIHGVLPAVVQGSSDSVVQHARNGYHRFVHVDASHLYPHVVADIQAAKSLLRSDGVVVFDDYRTEHTPGVGAAVWGALSEGLRPFAVTPVKLYATFGEPQYWANLVLEWAKDEQRLHEVQRIGNDDVVLVSIDPGTPAASAADAPTARPLRRLAGRIKRALR